MKKNAFVLLAFLSLSLLQQEQPDLNNLSSILGKLGLPQDVLSNALSSLPSPPSSLSDGKEAGQQDQPKATVSEEKSPVEAPKPTVHFTAEGSPVPANLLSFGQEDPNDKGSDIMPGRTYKGDTKGRTLVLAQALDEKSMYILKLTGSGSVVIEITTGANGTQFPDLVKQLTLESPLKPSVLPIDRQYLSIKGAALKVLAQNEPAVAGTFRFSVIAAKSLDIGFNTSVRIYTVFSPKTQVVVQNPALNADPSLANRLQFILQTSLESQQLFGGEEVEMLINEGGPFPSRTDFQLKASGTLGTGLIKTLSPRSPHYCFSESCRYFVSLFTSGVEYVNFFPTVFANDSVLKLNQFLFLIEEIEPGEQHVQYELEVPKTEDSWVFSAVPTMGAVELLINPDFRPKLPDEYKYYIGSHRPEEIIITATEAREFGFGHQKFFVAYKSLSVSEPAVFRFEARRLARGERKYIKENYAEAGVVAREEIVNYFLDLGSDFPQTLTAVFKLKSFFGQADLFVKECQPSEPACQVTAQEVSQGLAHEKRPRIFRASGSTHFDESTSSKSDYLTLSFNCSRQSRKTPFPNKYPVSKSCIFAVAVHCKDAQNKFGAYYKLVAHGKGAQSLIRLRAQTVVKVAPGEKAGYRVDVSRQRRPEETLLRLKVVALSGACSVFLSALNDEPSAMDNQAALVVQDDNLTSLRTKAYELTLPLPKPRGPGLLGQTSESWVFVGVESIDYCVLDFYADFAAPGAPEKTEAIRESNVLQRKIDGRLFLDSEEDASRVYYQNFLFKVPEKDQYSYYIAPKINLSLNSSLLGLKLCVLENKEELVGGQRCAFQSLTGHLAIDDKMTSLDKGKTFLVSVQKAVKRGENFSAFPIEFTLSLNQGVSYKEQELHMPGKLYSSVLGAGEAVQFKADFTAMQRRAQVYFYAEDTSAQANVSVGEQFSYFHLGTLDESFIGLSVQDGQAFKAQHCRGAQSCVVRISVYCFGAKGTRFSLLYVFDDQPILLGEGDQLIVANNIPTYFAFEADGQSSVSFSTFADHALSVIYAKPLPRQGAFAAKDVSLLLSDNDFSFKTNIENSPRIVLPQHFLQREDNRLLGFFVQPKMHFRAPKAFNAVELLGRPDSLTVFLRARTQKLLPFILTDGQGAAGEFAYYFLVIDHPQDFAVILTLHSGEAALFINKGLEDLPTEKRFWKKTANLRGDELLVGQEMFADPKEMVGGFTLGVRSAEQTRFSLLFQPEFKRLVKLRFQRLVDLELSYNQNYYFDFFNTHKNYATLLFAEESDIEVSALNFDQNKYQDFISMVTNEANYAQKFEFKKGELPRKKAFENSETFGTHIVVRIKPTEKDARVNFLIYNPALPIEVAAERRFTFVQDKGESSLFRAALDARYEEVDLDVKLDFGSIVLSYSDLQGKEENSLAISLPSQKYLTFRVPKTQKSNDVLIFNEFFLRVQSSEFSRFSVLLKPKDKFKQLKAFEPELLYTSPEKDVFLYYHISPQRAKTIRSLQFDLSSVQHYDERPELLFIAESDVVLNESSPFVPMPVLDVLARDSGEFKLLEVRADPRPGYFVLKIGRYAKRLPIKVSVGLNHHKNLEPNGLYHGSVPPSLAASHQYSVFLPKAGEFRLVLESCFPARIEAAEFFSSEPLAASAENEDHNVYQFHNETRSTGIKFEDRFVQGYSFLFLNETQLAEKREFRMLSYPVRRGFVEHRGLLRFKVSLEEGQSPLASLFHPDERYVLLTEFRPRDRELILKDYVRVFEESEEDSRQLFGYHYRQGNSELEVSARLPLFKPQLLLDYPALRSVRIKVYFYLFADKEVVEKLERCGESMLGTIAHNETVFERTLTREQLSLSDRQVAGALFNATALGFYRGALHLNVLSYVSVRFFESEEEEFNVNLDFKYTNVPYFLMTIPNRYGAFFSVGTGLGVALLIVFVFFVVFYWKSWQEREREADKKAGYGKAGENSFAQGNTKLEMSTVSGRD